MWKTLLLLCALTAWMPAFAEPLLPGTPIKDFGPVVFNPAQADQPIVITEGILVQLPFAVEAGDVIMLEPPTGLVVSDIVHFYNNLLDTGQGTGIGNLVFIFSDTEPGDPNDVPFPFEISANNTRIFEVGSENSLQITPYTAALPDGTAVHYLFISDVPEPSTMLLIGSGLLAIA